MTPSERREKKRVRFKDHVEVRRVIPSHSGFIYEVQGETILTQACDLCEMGIRLNLQHPVEPQSILKVNFKVKEKPVDVYARVVWSEQGLCGLKFIVLDNTCCKAIRKYVESETN